MQVSHTNPSAYRTSNTFPAIPNDSPRERPNSLSSAGNVVVRESSEYSSKSTTRSVDNNNVQISEVSVKHTYERLSLTSSSAAFPKESNTVANDVAVSEVGNGSNNETANTILKFIENRIQKDLVEGASVEEVESRLQAGLDGFKKGFAEAKAQLEAMGLFGGEENSVEEAINDTYDSVLAGIENLRGRFLGKDDTVFNTNVVNHKNDEAPTTKNPIPLGTPSNDAAIINNFSKLTSHQHVDEMPSYKKRVEASVMDSSARTRSSFGIGNKNIDRQQGVQNSFSFQVETADGDKVTVTAKTNDVTITKYSLFDTPLWQSEQLTRYDDQDSFFSITIDGDLDEEELKAIGDLVNKVETLSTNFFEGDLDLAFNQASQLGYDTNELVGFSLNLKHVEIERVRATYQEFLPANNSQNQQAGNLLDKLQPIGSFTQDLIDTVKIASIFNESHSLIVELAKKFEGQQSEEVGFSHRFSLFVEHLLENGIAA